MSELQPEGEVAPVESTVSTDATEAPNQGSDLAPETDAAPAKVEFNEQQQEVFNSAIGKKTAQARDFERRAEEAERKLQEAQAQIPQAQRPNVPDIPDRYEFNDDQEYIAALRKRDDSIREATTFDARQQLATEQAEQTKQAQLAEQHKALVDKATTYKQNAATLGVTDQQLQVSGAALANAGIGDEVAGYLLKDSEGPLIAEWLSRNPLDMEDVRSMSPMDAAVHINSNIRAKAAALKPKQSNAPAPAEHLSGGGVPDKQNPLLAGVTYE